LPLGALMTMNCSGVMIGAGLMMASQFFSAKEIKKFHLPIEGEWVDYYDLEPIKVTHLTTPYFMDVIKGERNG
jgi:hypothetical protein